MEDQPESPTSESLTTNSPIGSGHQSAPSGTLENRGLRKPYLLTLLLMLPLVFVVAVLVIPAKTYVLQSANDQNDSFDFAVHGWPAVHFQHIKPSQKSPPSNRREIKRIQSKLMQASTSYENSEEGQQVLFLDEYYGFWKNDGGHPYWTEASNWSYRGEISKIHWSGLAINLLIFGTALGLVSFLLFRRLSRKLFQISVSDLGCIVLLFAIWFGFRTNIQTDQNRRVALEALNSVQLYEKHQRADTEPDWLIRLIGRQWLPPSVHFKNVVLDFNLASEDEWRILKDNFSALRFAKTARISNFPSSDAALLRHLGRAGELTLVTPGLVDDDWSVLGNMKQIRKLRILGEKETKTKLSPAFFREIAKFDSLDTLVLEDCWYETDQLLNLQSLDRVERLSLTGSPVGAEVIAMAENMDQLFRLEVVEIGFHPDWRKALEQRRPKLRVHYGR